MTDTASPALADPSPAASAGFDWLISIEALIVAAVVLADLSALFILNPAIDLSVSGLGYRAGLGFFVDGDPVSVAVREAGRLATQIASYVVAALVLIKLVWPGRLTAIRLRVTLFLATSLALGPGLLVNSIFKELWGRPRPRDTDLFGGDAPFTLPWVITRRCTENCSFVSGEACSSFWLMALVLVAPPAWRRPVAIVTFSWALVMSANRVLVGGHYLSDVLIGWSLMALLILGLYQLIVLRMPDAIEARLVGAVAAATGLVGRTWRRWLVS